MNQSLRVLIVDDHPNFCREIRQLLETLEMVHVVGEAKDGLQALEMTERLRPDLVLMDQNMPGLSGVSATYQIKARWPHTRVLFVAASETPRNAALAAGAEGYFLKGEDTAKLVEMITNPPPRRRPYRAPLVKPPQQSDLPHPRLWKTIGLGIGILLLGALILIPGISLSTIALICGMLFFIYGLKYYGSVALILAATSGIGNNNGNGNGFNGVFNGFGATNGIKNGLAAHKPGLVRSLIGRILGRGTNGVTNGIRGKGGNHQHQKDNGVSVNGFKIAPDEQPFISIHLPLYNETRVVDRLLEACTRLDYKNYEVLVADDSTDETIRHLEKWTKHPKVRVSHRINRTGFKGAALKHAMEVMDPRTQFIAVFDADFIPPPTILHQFLSYFFNGNGHNGNNRSTNGDLEIVDESLAVVQGYQWHVLNASENWITRGIRTEFSGSYVVERPGQELTGGMKMISGSVFMIRADLLRNLGWGTSITEDWELTIRLYLEGYRVLFSPFIQAPAECVADFKQLARQRMRWSEGHTFNVKKYFFPLLRSPKLTKREKLEFLYYAPYYLQSIFFIFGTVAWFISEIFFRTHLPFWTATLGWSLVFTNTFALILMNTAGLFLERGIKRNLGGLLSFVLLTFLLVPYQAYSSLKGLLEPHEGGWHRTDKTGVITDVIDKLGMGRRMRRLMPKKKSKKGSKLDLEKRLGNLATQISHYIPRPIRRALRPGNLSFRVISGLVIGLMALGVLASGGQGVATEVSDPSNVFYFYEDTTPEEYLMRQTQPSGTQTSTDRAGTFYSDTFAVDWGVNTGTTTVYFYATSGSSSCNISLTLNAGSTSLGSGTLSIPEFADDYFSTSFNTSSYTFSEGERLSLEVGDPCSDVTLFWDGSRNDSRLETPTLAGRDVTTLLMALMVLVPVGTSIVTRNRKAAVWLVTLIFSILLTISLFVQQVMPASAEVEETTNTFWFYDDTTPEQHMMFQAQPSGTETSAAATNTDFYSDTFPADWEVNGGTSTVYIVAEVVSVGSSFTITLEAGSDGDWTQLGTNTQIQLTCPKQLITLTMSTSSYTFSSGERLRLRISTESGATIYWDGASNNSRLVTPTIVIAETNLLFLFVVYLIPIVTGLMTRKSRLGYRIISIIISIVVTLAILATQVYTVSAEISETTNTFWFYNQTTPQTYMMYQTQPSGSDQYFDEEGDIYFYSDTFPDGWSVQAGTTTVYMHVYSLAAIDSDITWRLYAGSGASWTELGSGLMDCPFPTNGLMQVSFSTSSHDFSSGEQFRLVGSVGTALEIDWDGAYNDSRIVTPTIVIPEWGLLFLLLVPLLPYLVSLFWKRRRFAGGLVTILLAGCVTLGLLGAQVQPVSAAPNFDVSNSNTFWWYDDTSPLTYMMYQTQPSGSNTSASNTVVSFYSDTWPADWQVNSGTSTVYFYVSTTGNRSVNFTLYAGTTGSWTSLGTGSWSGNQGSTPGLVSTSFSTSGYTFSTGDRLRLDVNPTTIQVTVYWDGSYNNSRLVIPGITVPENALILLVVVGLIPIVMGRLKRRKLKRIHICNHRKGNGG